eukprot:4761277-Pleurochrysis_carterae.AAC.1
MDGRLNETRQISADVKDLRALSEQLAAVRIELEVRLTAARSYVKPGSAKFACCCTSFLAQEKKLACAV